jgi:endo-1,4-beta-xylanase
MESQGIKKPSVRMPNEDDRQKAQDIFRQTAINIERHRKRKAVICFQTASGEPLQDSTINITQETQDFLFGNLVFDLVWGEPPYRPELFKQRFQELFNFAIFPFYWPHYEPNPGMPRWQAMLPVLEWCLANRITPKGHPLVWPYSAGVPEWLYDMPEEVVEELIRSRVLNIVKGFEPQIKIWDVTNEAVNHISWSEATQRSFHSRYHEIDLWRGIEVNGSFKREIPIPEAADWVEKSLRWAYAANPEATLIVNDYNQEIDLNVRQRFFDLIKELQARQAPISGIGLQVHPVNHWIWPQELWETVEMYAALDLPIHITELHQPSWEQEIEGGWKQGTWTEDTQAEYMAQLYTLCFGHPSVVSINHWGLSDRNIWIPGGGLIDTEYHPKPVFKKLKQLIKQEWMTPPFSVSTGKDGLISFSGFLGQYKLSLQQSGRQYATYMIHVAENEKNNWVFRVG